MPAPEQLLFSFNSCIIASRTLLAALSCLQLLKPELPLQRGINRKTRAVGCDGQFGGNPTWAPSSIVLTVCGCHAAGNEVSRQARQQQQHYLPQLGWTAAAFPATPAAEFYSELSWWVLKSSLP
jgi:hypothetical protein